MFTQTKSGSPFRGSLSSSTAGKAESDTSVRLSGLRNAYFTALLQEREAGNLSTGELLNQLQLTTEHTADVLNETFSTVLSPEERKRLKNAGVSRHGFIAVCLEKAREMPSLLPPWLTLDLFEDNCSGFEAMQTLLDTAQRCDRLAADMLMTAADRAYRDALAFYKCVKDAVAGKVPGAEVIFEKLSTYFKAHGQRRKDEPAAADVERDVRSLLHGTKEGRVVVENTMPHTVAGTRRVIDETN